MQKGSLYRGFKNSHIFWVFNSLSHKAMHWSMHILAFLGSFSKLHCNWYFWLLTRQIKQDQSLVSGKESMRLEYEKNTPHWEKSCISKILVPFFWKKTDLWTSEEHISSGWASLTSHTYQAWCTVTSALHRCNYNLKTIAFMRSYEKFTLCIDQCMTYFLTCKKVKIWCA